VHAYAIKASPFFYYFRFLLENNLERKGSSTIQVRPALRFNLFVIVTLSL